MADHPLMIPGHPGCPPVCAASGGKKDEPGTCTAARDQGGTANAVSDPIREYESHTGRLTRNDLAKARRTLTGSVDGLAGRRRGDRERRPQDALHPCQRPRVAVRLLRLPAGHLGCRAAGEGRTDGTYGKRSLMRALPRRSRRPNEAMGMDWADWHGTKEAIPPAYTEFIGEQLIRHLKGIEVRADA